MDLRAIKEKVLKISPYVKNIEIIVKNDTPFAIIYPNFEKLKKDTIINIEEELRWYAVEEYNLHADEDKKIRGYKIIANEIDKTEIEEFNDETYKILHSIISKLSSVEIFPSSHLELVLGLDSLNYVELFVSIEQSFGVKTDEMTFSGIMTVKALYEYIKKNQRKITKSSFNWSKTLDESIDEELIYSPFIMLIYKIILLPLFKLYFRIEVKGIENIPSTSTIFAPTHQSMLDGFLIESTLPFKVLKKTFFLAYTQVFGVGLMKPIAKHGQGILIDANQNLTHTMQYVALALKKRANLVIFPEGARTRDGKLLKFRPFFAMLSKTFNAPVVPIIIDGTFNALRSGKTFPLPKKVKITYLKPINPDGMSYEELRVKVKEAIELEIKNSKQRGDS